MQGQGYALLDPTICSQCKTDWGNTELRRVANLPFCENCRQKLYCYPFPKWLQASLFVSMLLLLFALVHGFGYFRLGRDLYRGERQMSAHAYPEAIHSLAPVADAAPECDKCVLLLSKAYLLTGHPEQAWNVSKKHNNGSFDENDEQFREVKSLFDRFVSAAQKMETAQKLAISHKEEEALQAARAAAAEYPEWDVPRLSIITLEAGVAFEHQDYDKFLAISQQSYASEPRSAMTSAAVASALACKYATTGDEQYRLKAEGMLEEARSLVSTKEEKNEYQEYAERIEHRLKTREIITKEEYDRRFRSKDSGEAK